MEQASYVTESFNLFVPSPADIVVLRNPPWWQWRHIAVVVFTLIACVAGTMIWVTMLRRRVSSQTQLIREKLADEARLKEEAQAASRAKSEIHDYQSNEIHNQMY